MAECQTPNDSPFDSSLDVGHETNERQWLNDI